MNLTHTLSNLEKQQLAGKFVAEAFSNYYSSIIKKTAETIFNYNTRVHGIWFWLIVHATTPVYIIWRLSIIYLYTGGAGCVLYLCDTCQGLESNHVPIASGSNLMCWLIGWVIKTIHHSKKMLLGDEGYRLAYNVCICIYQPGNVGIRSYRNLWWQKKTKRKTILFLFVVLYIFQQHKNVK